MKLIIEGKQSEIDAFLRQSKKYADVTVTKEDEEARTLSVGDKVRLISADYCALNGFRDGDIATITKTNCDGAYKVEIRKENSGLDGYTDLDNLEPVTKLTRRRVVEDAKADIKIITDAAANKLSDDGNVIYRFSVTKPYFIVNREKKTVVCLAKGGNKPILLAKGKAKCAPDDAFNAWIGKAIAARRAYGLPVPDEYLNPPQPKGIEFGDIIHAADGSVRKVVKDYAGDGTAERGSLNAQCGAYVIDDTDRVYYK